jgi:YHS domain-containing protein
MFGKRDPVCGAKVDKKSKHAAEYSGKTYYFDCAACKSTFEQVVEKKARKGGLLESLAKDREEVPRCCHDMKK